MPSPGRRAGIEAGTRAGVREARVEVEGEEEEPAGAPLGGAGALGAESGVGAEFLRFRTPGLVGEKGGRPSVGVVR